MQNSCLNLFELSSLVSYAYELLCSERTIKDKHIFKSNVLTVSQPHSASHSLSLLFLGSSHILKIPEIQSL